MPRFPVKRSTSSVATIITCFHSRSFLWATARLESGWPWGWKTAMWRCCMSPSPTSTSSTCTRAACCRSSSLTVVSKPPCPPSALLPSCCFISGQIFSSWMYLFSEFCSFLTHAYFLILCRFLVSVYFIPVLSINNSFIQYESGLYLSSEKKLLLVSD